MAFSSRIRNGLVKFFFNKSQLICKYKPDSISKKNTWIVEEFIIEDNITSITYHGKDITSSYVRTWHDKSKIPYKYEFRGDKFQAYLNPSEIVIVCN